MDSLFRLYRRGSLDLRNRIVMAPMTRGKAPGGVVGAENVAYYRRRAEAEVGLIITEGTWIDDPAAATSATIPRFHGDDALAGWAAVVDAVHAAGGRIMPQLWHVGMMRVQGPGVPNPDAPSIGPSGIRFTDPDAKRSEQVTAPMTEARIAAVIESYARAAGHAFRLGFDGVELHAAHGYLIDQFFWSATNRRTDRWGGDLAARTRFAAEIIAACRRSTAPDFPICVRFSQWKTVDYDARIVQSPQELERFLAPLVEAGATLFHCSTRRFWEPAFAGSPRTFAGWTRTLSGCTTIAVGSVGLDHPHETSRIERQHGYTAHGVSLDRVIAMLEGDEFDLVAVGRALLVDPFWVQKVREGAWDRLVPYSTAVRDVMY